MTAEVLSVGYEDEADRLVEIYEKHKRLLSTFLGTVELALQTDRLSPLIHSTKKRLKDPEHLKRKLLRKRRDAEEAGKLYEISGDNLLQKVTDLVGVRLLHLHTRQMEQIHPLILEAFEEAQFPLVEPPFARTWDDESRTFFKGLGLQTQDSPWMYTSVHYVIQSHSKTVMTAEIQVRTLAEELWGEVDHAINYPERTQVGTCREQLKVLARVTSSCTRLVDSIFDAHAASGSDGGKTSG